MNGEREMTLQDVANHACEMLPNGWSIEIHMENGAGCVNLWDPDGNQTGYAGDSESLQGSVIKAVQHAVKYQGDYE